MDEYTLATLAADPERVANVPPEHLPELVGAAEALRARLWARLQEAAAPKPPAERTPGSGEPDRLLKAKEAAEILNVDTRWMYRHADSLPFTKRLADRVVRFSERGLRRWIENRR